MEMDVFPDEFKVAGKGKLKSYEVEHDSLTQASVESLMKSEIEYTSNLCGLDVSIFSLTLIPSSPPSSLGGVPLRTAHISCFAAGDLVPALAILQLEQG